MKILLVEDDAHTADFIMTDLAAKVFLLSVMPQTGTTGMDLGREEQFDAAVIDIMLPVADLKVDLLAHKVCRLAEKFFPAARSCPPCLYPDRGTVVSKMEIRICLGV
ncbi:hypothetical protein [Desulfolithobacter sp.]